MYKNPSDIEITTRVREQSRSDVSGISLQRGYDVDVPFAIARHLNLACLPLTHVAVVTANSNGEPEPNSVTAWFAGLRDGDAEAVRKLWERFSNSLIAAARNHLGRSPRQAADEEDVVISVFAALCRGAEAGRFRDIRNRDDLWWLLLALTHRKAVSQMRRETAEKRGGSAQRLSLDMEDSGGHFTISPEELMSDEPTPEYLATLRDEHARLLDALRNDVLKRIASLRLQGLTVREIGDELGLGLRSIERKLKLIRQTWAGLVLNHQ